MKKEKKKKELKVFEVQGKLLLKNREQVFSKTLKAYNEKNAAERALTQFGSKNNIKRRNIQITEIKAHSAQDSKKK